MTLLHFRRPLLALLPALLALASCGGDDNDPTPAADQGRVLFVHAASNVNTVGLRFLVDNAEKAQLNYGQSSGYQSIQAGSRAVQVTAGGQAAASQNITVEKDRSYSYFAAPSTSTSTVATLLVPDDLTAPTSGKARIRVVNLSQNVASNIKLAQVTTGVNGPIVQTVVTDVAPGTASAFTEFTPASYNLSILDNADKSIATVGDGSGNGNANGTKNYEAGKIYTVVVTGTEGSLTPEQRIRVYLSQNN